MQIDELRHRLHLSLNAPAMKYGSEIQEVSEELDRAKESLQRSEEENAALKCLYADRSKAAEQQYQKLLAKIEEQKLYISGLQAGQRDLRAQRDQAISDKAQCGRKKDDGLQGNALEAELRRSQEYIECLTQERDHLLERVLSVQSLQMPWHGPVPHGVVMLGGPIAPLPSVSFASSACCEVPSAGNSSADSDRVSKGGLRGSHDPSQSARRLRPVLV